MDLSKAAVGVASQRELEFHLGSGDVEETLANDELTIDHVAVYGHFQVLFVEGGIVGSKFAVGVDTGERTVVLCKGTGNIKLPTGGTKFGGNGIKHDVLLGAGGSTCSHGIVQNDLGNFRGTVNVLDCFCLIVYGRSFLLPGSQAHKDYNNGNKDQQIPGNGLPVQFVVKVVILGVFASAVFAHICSPFREDKIIIALQNTAVNIGEKQEPPPTVVGGGERGIFFMVFEIHFLCSQAPLS